MKFPWTVRNVAMPAVVALVAATAAHLRAQDFSLGLADADRMADEGILPEALRVLFDPTFGGMVKGAVSYSLSASAMYSSNIFGASGGGGDTILSLSPAVFYTTDPEGEAICSITAYYAPSYQRYLDHPDLGGLNHSGGVRFQAVGGRSSMSVFANIAQSSGTDRLTDTYSEATTLSGGISARYQIAPRTSIDASLTASSIDYGTGGLRGGERYSARLGAWWAASERLKFGPSIRYRITDSPSAGRQTALGLLFNVSYSVTDRIQASGHLGVESRDSSRGSGDDDLQLTGRLGVGYIINDLWSAHASIRYVDVPAPDARNYAVNDLSATVSIVRQLSRGAVHATFSYGLSDYEEIGGAVAARGSEDFFSASIGYSRPLFSERVGFFSSIGYSRSSGGRDWDQWQVATGVNIQF